MHLEIVFHRIDKIIVLINKRKEGSNIKRLLILGKL